MYRPPRKKAQEKEVLCDALDHPVTRVMPMTGNPHATTIIIRRALMQRMCTRTRRDVRSVEIQIT